MPDTNERLQQAIAAARAGNTAEARELVDGLVADHPDNPHALFLRGMLAGTQEEQVEYLNRVLEIDPEHKAANRRLAQIAPAMEEAPPAEAVDATIIIVDEPEESEEPEAFEETGAAETVVGAAALFASEDDEEPEAPGPVAEEAGEWDATETLVTAAAVGSGLDALEDDSTMVEPAWAEESYPEEEAAEWVDDTVITAATAAGAIAAADQVEEIPDWLMAETRSEEELSQVTAEDIWAEAPAEEAEDLPDWLTEKPGDDWEESGAGETAIFVAEEPDDTVHDDAGVTEDPAEVADDSEDDGATEIDEVTEDDQEEEVVEEKPKKKSADRGLEVALVILLAVALLIVIGLAYVVLYPPF